MTRLQRAARKAAEDPAIEAKMLDAGFVAQYMPPDEITRRMQTDMAKFRKIATDAKLALE